MHQSSKLERRNWTFDKIPEPQINAAQGPNRKDLGTGLNSEGPKTLYEIIL